jgi:hypothetical protein
MSPQPRVQTHSNPEIDECGEDDGGQEVERELVIAPSHAAKVLRRSFDWPAAIVAPLIVPDRTFAGASSWNDWYGAH